MVLLSILIPAILGFLAITAILQQEKQTSLFERICLSYPLGTGFLTLQMFFLGLMRVPLTLGYTSIPVLVEIAVLVLWMKKKNVPLIPSISFGLFDEIRASTTGMAKKTAMIVLLAWSFAKLVSVFVETGTRPIWAWDSWADWSVGSKVFFYTKSLLLDVPSNEFFGKGVVTRFINYPLLNTLSQTWISLWIGSFDEVLVKFWTPVFLLSLAGYLYSFTSREVNRIAALAFLVIFLSSPLMSYHAVEVYSDLPLGVYLFLASISFLHAMRGWRSYWVLVGLFCTMAMFTKDEALFFSAPLIVSALYFIMRNTDEPRSKKNIAFQMLMPFLLIAPWYVFKAVHHLGLGGDTNSLKFVFHPEIFFPAVRQMLLLDNFNVFLVFFPVLLVTAGKLDKEFLHILFAFASYVLFFLMLYCFTFDYYNNFFVGTAFFRNMLTYYPVLTLLTAMLLKKTLPRMATTPLPKKRR